MDDTPWGVLWEEGLFLQPHHFQQMSLGAQAIGERHLRYTVPHAWGVAALDVDPLQLENGNFEIRKLEMLLPSGEVIDFRRDGGGNAITAPRKIPSVADSRLTVYAGVRRLRDNEPNVRDPDEDELDPPRYVRSTRTVADMTTGRNLIDIHHLRMNVRVFFEGDRMDGFEVAPIAELVAPAPGLPMTRLNPAYIPPSVRIGATEAATGLMKEVYAEAAAKASELAGAATAADVVAGNATEAELIQLWKLMVLRSALPGLREAADAGLHHPYQVHVQLCSLLGQFVTLSPGRSAPTIPPYDHNDLGACLHEVCDALLELLRADHLAANFRRVPLSRGDLPFGGLGMGAQSLDAQLLNARNEFYVAFNNPAPGTGERDWYRSGHIKIAAATRISDVVVQRKYGVPALPCPKPRALPARANALYYRLRIDASAGPEARAEWEAIVRERTLVIHFATKGLVPGEPAPDLAMEAYVVFGR